MRPFILLAFVGMLAQPLAASAELADRFKPLNLTAQRQGTLDLAKKVVVFSGNVVIVKGTILIEADRVEIRDLPNGSRLATAYGAPGKQATFKQKRDKLDEFIVGRADRVEYDENADTVRFVQRAVAQRYSGDTVVDEIHGDVLVYNSQAEFFSASSNVPTGSPGAGTTAPGRVSVTLTPREAASAPVVTPPPQPVPAPP